MSKRVRGGAKRSSMSRDESKRSPRVPVNFAVNLEGRTASGESFSVRAEAERVSRSGGTIIAEVDVSEGARVFLTPPFGKVLEAQVNGVWIDEGDGRQRIGVKLLATEGWFAE